MTASVLPNDCDRATLLGRVWLPANQENSVPGPTPILIENFEVIDLSSCAPTVSQLLMTWDSKELREIVDQLPRLGNVHDLIANSIAGQTDQRFPYLLAPVDLQCIKAAGVTFATSLIERVIEERAGGDPNAAKAFRGRLAMRIQSSLTKIVPGSSDALRVKRLLQQEGLWSQYLEVGIGPHAELFTKCPVLAAVGYGAEIGIRSDSKWNNPEPEVVLIANHHGVPVGASLGNDVNLRDLEGLSALLLGKAKDNTASCSIGPFIRLFDGDFGLQNVRDMVVKLEIHGRCDDFVLRGESRMSEISRDPLNLLAQTVGENHQYPDGLALFLGTMFAPTEDRDQSGVGFTHKIGDTVAISSDQLGTLSNTVNYCRDVPPWTFGVAELLNNLVYRGLIGKSSERKISL